MTATTGRRRSDVQGLRALAVLLVVAYHAGLHVEGGFTGVDVFFVISGFVITRVLLGELHSDGRLNLPRFYGRRVRRLMPALAVVVLAVALTSTLFEGLNFQVFTAKTGISALLFSANGFLFRMSDGYFALDSSGNPLLHTWTLAVEEQFYVIFPGLLYLTWRFVRISRVSRRALMTIAVAVLTLGSFVFSLALSYGHTLPGLTTPSRFAFYASPTRAWEFGVGALLALGEDRLVRVPRLVAELVGAGGLALILFGAFTISDARTFPGLAATIPVLGSAAAIAAGTSGNTFTSRVLAFPVATRVGDLSYSLYLWHWPFIVDARALWPASAWAGPIAAGLSFLPAWLSFRYVENPIRFSPRLRGRRILALAGTCVAVPAVGCGVLVGVHHALARTSTLSASEQATVVHLNPAGCQSVLPLGSSARQACTWPAPHARGTIVLIGDSNAGHFFEPVAAAVRRLGYNLEVATPPGCPFVTVLVKGGIDSSQTCLEFNESSLRYILAQRPALVITANRPDTYIDTNRYQLASVQGGTSSSRAGKTRIWEEGLTTTLHRLSLANIPVLLVHPIPRSAIPPGGCVVIRVLLGACDGSYTRAHVDASLKSSLSIEDSAITKSPGASAVGFEDSLCGQSSCFAVQNGVYLYYDTDHLSRAGAIRLAPEVYAAIQRKLQEDGVSA